MPSREKTGNAAGVVGIVGKLPLEQAFFVSGLGEEEWNFEQGGQCGGPALPGERPAERHENDAGVERVTDPPVDAALNQHRAGSWAGEGGAISAEHADAEDPDPSAEGDEQETGGRGSGVDGGWVMEDGQGADGEHEHGLNQHPTGSAVGVTGGWDGWVVVSWLRGAFHGEADAEGRLALEGREAEPEEGALIPA